MATKRQPDLTRRAVLDCAFEEIHRSGFRAASLEAILERSGVTKGALYHHFGSKTELGYAVIEEAVRPWVEESWRPVLEADDVIAAAITLARELPRRRLPRLLTMGCPFNNLINEMAAVDAGFRTRLQAILDDWRDGIVDGLRRGQASGHVRRDLNPQAAAAFIISAVEGSVGLAKARHSREFLDSALEGLVGYLESLRPR